MTVQEYREAVIAKFVELGLCQPYQRGVINGRLRQEVWVQVTVWETMGKADWRLTGAGFEDLPMLNELDAFRRSLPEIEKVAYPPAPQRPYDDGYPRSS